MSEAQQPIPEAVALHPGPEGGAAWNVSELLGEAGAGDRADRDGFFKAVYGELRAMAGRKMASERAGHTLQPTALVHEAWLKIGERTFANRAHFFATAAAVMRYILVDSARKRSQRKRGGDLERVELVEDAIAAPQEEEQLLMVNEAVDTLAMEDPLKAEIVKLRYFAGLSHQEIADVLGVNEKTVRRHWEVARVRLFQLVSSAPKQREIVAPTLGESNGT